MQISCSNDIIIVCRLMCVCTWNTFIHTISLCPFFSFFDVLSAWLDRKQQTKQTKFSFLGSTDKIDLRIVNAQCVCAVLAHLKKEKIFTFSKKKFKPEILMLGYIASKRERIPDYRDDISIYTGMLHGILS